MTPFIMIISREYHDRRDFWGMYVPRITNRWAAYWIKQWLKGQYTLVELSYKSRFEIHSSPL